MNTDKIKDMLAALRNVNIRDLQNIDARELGEMLRQRIDIVLNVVLVLVTIAATVGIVKGYGKKAQALALEITQMQDRAGAVKESQRLKGEYAALFESFPKPILADQLMNKLSGFAAYRQVQVLSFSPAKEKGGDYITVAGIQINVAAEDYKNIVLFMKDIEDAPYALRVKQWSARMKEQKAKEGTEEVKKQIVEANMQIDFIKLKNE